MYLMRPTQLHSSLQMVTDSSNLVAIKPGDKHWGETFTHRIKTWLSAITQEPVVTSWPSWSSGSIQSRNFSMPETWTFHNPILIANFYSRLQLRASDAKNLVMQSFNVKPGLTINLWWMVLKSQTRYFFHKFISYYIYAKTALCICILVPLNLKSHISSL